MSAEIVGISFAVEPARGCYIPVGHRYAGAPAQLDRARGAGRAEAVARRRRAREARPEPQVRRSMCSPIMAIELRGCAHDTELESYVLESHKPHDLDSLARRHLDLHDDRLRRR